MPGKPREELANRTSAVCRQCGRSLPAANFYPSTLARQLSPSCKECHHKADHAAKKERRQQHVIALRAAFEGRETWTSREAATVLGLGSLSAGAALEPLHRDGLIERLREGVYRFPVTASPPEVVEQLAIVEPASSPRQVVPSTPQAVFIGAGSYLFGASNIAVVEYDDRGRVSVMLNVQETRSQGYVGPVSYEFAGDEANQIIAGVSLLRGMPPVELTERITVLERKLSDEQAARKRYEAEAGAAMALAEELQAKLDKFRSLL